MVFTGQQNDLLALPLDAASVRKGGGSFGPKGDYIEGWHAIAEANRIFGFDGWSYTMSGLTQTSDAYQNEKQNWVVSYICTVIVTVGGVTRQDVGYGSGASKQVGDAHEGAVKEAVTDALKRALRTFGNAFGLALYDKDKRQVADSATVAQLANSKAKARPIYERLADELQTKASTTLAEFDEWKALPATQEAFKSLPTDWRKGLASEAEDYRSRLMDDSAHQEPQKEAA